MKKPKRTEKPVELQAYEFWNRQEDRKLQELAHWRGRGRYRDEQRWLSIGEFHRAMWEALRAQHPREGRFRTLMEWGPGGGSNVVAFGNDLFQEVIGVDISLATLGECERTASLFGVPFMSVLNAPDNIDEAMTLPRDVADAFLCTAVFQHMASRAAVEEVLRAASEHFVRPGGLALVQWRNGWRVRERRKTGKGADYFRNVARWVVFRDDEFLGLCDRAGWRVLQVEGKEGGGRSGYMYAFLENKR